MGRFIDDAERRSRLGRRHRLAAAERIDDVATIADDLVAVHSSDPATVYLTLGARMANPRLAVIDSALYDDVSLIRHHAMRRTMWVMTPAVAVLAHAAATAKVAKVQRKRTIDSLATAAAIADPEAWLAEATAEIRLLIARRGAMTAREVGQSLPHLAVPIRIGGGNHTVAMNAHPRVMQFAGFDGDLVRGRPTGGWTSSEYRWDSMQSVLGRPIGDLEEADAAGELLGRWLDRFGPATITDITWWFGWTVGLAKTALARSEAIEVETSLGQSFVANGDDQPVGHPEPWVAVLPGLDATSMGWKQRDFYLDTEMVPRVFDRFGNAGPKLWADGRIVGGWAQRQDGSIALDILSSLTDRQARLLSEEAHRVSQLIGDTVVRPRFPSPNQKELLAEH